jgi:nitronate monooxygenase
MTQDFPQLDHPIVQAPLAGGPSTPQLAAAVSGAGALGFLAAGYKSPADLADDITRTREMTSAPVGVNLFCLAETPIDHARLAAYAKAIERDAHRHHVGLGEPHFDDDAFQSKLDVVCRERPPIVSFTFGCPAPEVVQRLHERDIAVWVTVTEVDEALFATRAGADALVVQGVEAGGHRGGFEDADGRGEVTLLPLLRLVARACELPLVASGGIADGAGVAAVLAAGARAAQIGTAFMRCPEAATSDAHRDALERSDADSDHPSLQRSARPRDRQRLHARPRRSGPTGLPAREPTHGAAASRRAQSRGRRCHQPVGRPSPYPR